MATLRQPAGQEPGKFGDLRRRLLFLLRRARRVPHRRAHPGARHRPERSCAELFKSQQGGILGMFNMFSGGALSRFTDLRAGHHAVHLGVDHHAADDRTSCRTLEALKKEGESGRRKITQYTRYGTLVLALFQALGHLRWRSKAQPGLVLDPGLGFRVTAVVTLVTGTMFLMWLGEQITERGLGNGISIIIFAGIVAGSAAAPSAALLELVRTGAMQHRCSRCSSSRWSCCVTAFVVFVERGQRKILVNYAKRQVGNKVYGGQSSHLPLKLNMAGVIPPIFASSHHPVPGDAASAGSAPAEGMALAARHRRHAVAGAADLRAAVRRGDHLLLLLLHGAGVQQPTETADNLKKSGAFIPGIRPGEQTARYIDKILTRLTLAGAIYITLVCLLPEFLILKWNVPFYFGGTSLLIIVVVTMDFMAQVQAYVMTHQYESLLKKANFKAT